MIMRWKHKPFMEGDRRIIKRFLWSHTLLNGEYRWLERAKILQVVKKVPSHPFGWVIPCIGWRDDKWVGG